MIRGFKVDTWWVKTMKEYSEGFEGVKTTETLKEARPEVVLTELNTFLRGGTLSRDKAPGTDLLTVCASPTRSYTSLSRLRGWDAGRKQTERNRGCSGELIG